MVRRLFATMVLLVMLLLLAATIALFMIGRFTSAQEKTQEALSLQIKFFEKEMHSHFEHLQLMAIQLSQQAGGAVDRYLEEQDIAFADLTDSQEHLSNLQRILLEPLRQRILQSDCSGAFIMLDATVNSALADSQYSRSGLYIQRAGLEPSNTDMLLYRGNPSVSQKQGVLPHRKWHLEFDTRMISGYDKAMNREISDIHFASTISDLWVMPGTSEPAVHVLLPILGMDGSKYGLCGLEVSQSYFKLLHAQPTNFSYLSCTLSEPEEGILNGANGLSCGVVSGYFLPVDEKMEIEALSGELNCYRGSDTSYVGISKETTLFDGAKPMIITTMIRKAEYDEDVLRSNLQLALMIILLFFFVFNSCWFFSKRYLMPILKGLEQMKKNMAPENPSGIAEIDELFAFLSEQYRAHAEIEHQYQQVSADYAHARAEINRLSNRAKKDNADPDIYELFRTNLKTLTPTEKKVFEHYISGRTVKEILDMEGIKESTLKFHNRNIYTKLGISSRKELLMYAALMQKQA